MWSLSDSVRVLTKTTAVMFVRIRFGKHGSPQGGGLTRLSRITALFVNDGSCPPLREQMFVH